MGDPSNVFAVDDIRTITGADIYTVVATAGSIHERSTSSTASTARSSRSPGRPPTSSSDDDDLSSVSEVIEDAPIVKFVNLLITPGRAATARRTSTSSRPSSDLRIRFRIDGVLHEVMHSPKRIQAGVISRLKVMADINIAERRIPQDGRIVGDDRRQARSTSASRPCRRCSARRSSCGSSTRARPC